MSSRVRSYARPSSTASRIAGTIAAAPSAPSLPVIANGETFARWSTSLARRRPIPATHRWSRRNPWTRMFVAANRAASSSTSIVAASGPSLSSGGEVCSVARSTHQIPARRSVPCSVSSSAGTVAPSNTKRA